MQVSVAVTPAWSRSKLHSTSLCRRVCGTRRTATTYCNRPRQTPSAVVRTRCASPDPASERHSEHHHHARLICSLLAAVTLVSLARASIIEKCTRQDCIDFVRWRAKEFIVCPTSLHCFMELVNVTQVMSPPCALARGGSTLRDQSRDMEAEMQQLIQSRQRTGQSSLPGLKLNSVNFYA